MTRARRDDLRLLAFVAVLWAGYFGIPALIATWTMR